jgi:DNA-binding CsgD family transcriptional regulator
MKFTNLTKTQNKIAKLALVYPTIDEIAEHLVISRATIDSHLNRIYKKLGINRFSQLVSVSAMKTRSENQRLKLEVLRLKAMLKEVGINA